MSDSDRLAAIATARRGMAKRQISQDFGIEEVKRGRRVIMPAARSDDPFDPQRTYGT